MRKITDVLNNRKKELEYMENVINQKMRRAPKGHLRVTYSEGKPRYYYVSELENAKYKYLKKIESNQIRALAQKDYFTKLLKATERELRWIEDAWTIPNISRKMCEKSKSIVPWAFLQVRI